MVDNKEWQGCNLLDMSQLSCKIFLNKNKGGGLGFWTVIKMVKERFKESRKGETNKIGEGLFIGDNANKKERQRKEECLQMVMGLWFKKLRGKRKRSVLAH